MSYDTTVVADNNSSMRMGIVDEVAIGWGVRNWSTEREVAVCNIIFQDDIVSSAPARYCE